MLEFLHSDSKAAFYRRISDVEDPILEKPMLSSLVASLSSKGLLPVLGKKGNIQDNRMAYVMGNVFNKFVEEGKTRDTEVVLSPEQQSEL